MRLISFIKACICMHLTFVEFCKLSNIVQARRQGGGVRRVRSHRKGPPGKNLLG